MGEERGAQKGSLRGQRGMLEGQLRARFGDVPMDARERLAAADAKSLERWSVRVLTATSIAEVFVDR